MKVFTSNSAETLGDSVLTIGYSHPSFIGIIEPCAQHAEGVVGRDEDPELFFPVGTSGPAIAQIADAKLVCGRCPVTAECLSWALESGQDAGVWGGMSEDERRALKRRNARTRTRSSV